MNKSDSGQDDAALEHSATALRFLAGGGLMGERMRLMDWTATPLGPAAQWPQGLRAMVRLMLTTQTPVFIYWGEEATCLYNDAVAPALGPERFEESLGRPGRQVWSEIWEDIGPDIQAVRQGRGETIYESRYLKLADGSLLRDSWWNYSQSPIDDPASPGGIGGVLVISSEITGIVLAKEALASERRRLLSLFEQSSTFLAALSGKEHRFELTNQAYRTLVGRTDLVGRTVREALPEVQEQGLVDALDEVYRSGDPFIARSMPVHLQRTARGELETRWLDFIYHRVDSAEGEPTGVLAEGFDVTEQVTASHSLKSANEALKGIMAYSPDLIVTAGADGLITRVSESSRDILAVEPQAFEGRHCATLVGDGTDIEGIMGQIMSGEPLRSRERRLLRNDGSVATIRWSVVWAAEPEMIVAIGRDVSERIISEDRLRQAQKMEAIGQLTGGVAHDFNNLLTVIIGSLEMLANGVADDPDLEPLAALALNAAERGAEVTSQLLSFARRQAQQPVAMTGSEVAAGFAPLARAVVRENIQLEIAGFSDDWSCLADKGQLHAALLNLCINARDAMGEAGWLSVVATVESMDAADLTHEGDPEPGEYACIRVSDTGCGMSADVLAHAIEPFFTTKAVGQGTGLGLSMVYGFVQQTGGFIRIHSEPESGTSVAIYLPRPIAAGGVVKSSPVIAVGRTARILVAEDNDLVRKQVARQLEALGHEVVMARDGSEALRILAEQADFDLLFTDMVMPGPVDGRRLAEQARARAPELKVLFTTGYAELVHGAHGSLDGPLLTKPYKQSELAHAVLEILGAKPAPAPEVD